MNKREEKFRKAFEEFMKSHSAEYCITTDYGQAVLEITLDGAWDKDGNCIDEYVEFEL